MGDTTSATPRSRRRFLFLAAAIVALIVVVLSVAATLYTESLWFREVNASQVYSTMIWTRVGLAAVFGAAFVIVLLANIWVARRVTPVDRALQIPEQIVSRYRATVRPYARRALLLLVVLGGLITGARVSSGWRNYLLWRHAADVGKKDPVLGKDLGFFLFKLPFESTVLSWATATLIVAILATIVAHYATGGIRPQRRGERVAPVALAHLAVLAALLLLVKAWGYRLAEYRLLFSGRGPVVGASYADVHAQLPVLRMLVVMAIVAAAVMLLTLRARTWLLPLAAVILVAVPSIIGGGVYPSAVQRLKVRPDERTLELPSLERNIAATRDAYGIAAVQHRAHPGTGPLGASTLRANRETIANIRLWTPDVLRNVYLNLQRIKQYYQFVSPVDVDRYDIGGTQRQVMIATREISPNGLAPDAKTWVNTHLFYTHGYGAVANLADSVGGGGKPGFLLGGIPSAAAEIGPELSVAQVYFGENEEIPYIVVGSKQAELDYPTTTGGSGYETNRYDGNGGIRLGGFFKRAAFAIRFRDLNLLISGAITDDSRLMFRRQIYNRVARMAPFLTIDGDPYAAIADGRLMWILDGYTTTNSYPSAQRSNFSAVSGGLVPGSGNYIRDAVKFVVDAKDGSVRGYVWDETDPLIRAWMRAFPGLLRPRAEMPADVAAHVRYPEGLFQIQSDMYADYHVTDPGTLYQKEDAWLIGRDPAACVNATATCQNGTPPPVPPYYMQMRLPGAGSRFVLVRPFTPAGGDRQNMVSYLTAQGDPQGYGTLLAYEFPRSQQVFGPEQVQAVINQDPAVSQQVSLWNQQHSKVIYGDLLIVPVGDTLLYVQPLYLRGEGSLIPELKRVVAVANGRVAMADSLEDALTALIQET